MSAEAIVAILGAALIFGGFVLLGVFVSWIAATGVAMIVIGNAIHLEMLYVKRWEETGTP